MRALKIAYWSATGIISLMMVFSAWNYLSNPEMKVGFQHLGFPDYFRIELAVAKIMAAVLLLLPFNGWWKEWSYAGLAITFVSAIVAHTASGDPVGTRIAPVVFLIILIVSYISKKRLDTRAYSDPLSGVSSVKKRVAVS